MKKKGESRKRNEMNGRGSKGEHREVDLTAYDQWQGRMSEGSMHEGKEQSEQNRERLEAGLHKKQQQAGMR